MRWRMTTNKIIIVTAPSYVCTADNVLYAKRLLYTAHHVVHEMMTSTPEYVGVHINITGIQQYDDDIIMYYTVVLYDNTCEYLDDAAANNISTSNAFFTRDTLATVCAHKDGLRPDQYSTQIVDDVTVIKASANATLWTVLSLAIEALQRSNRTAEARLLADKVHTSSCDYKGGMRIIREVVDIEWV